MDKTTLLDTIQSERAHFEAIIAPLNETQLCSPTLDGDWSVKDIMAHIAEWELICARWLAEFARGETPDPAERLDMESNNRIYQQYRECALSEVEQLFDDAHQEFLRQVNQVAEAFIEDDLNAAHRNAWTESWPGFSVVAAIADNSYEHYQNHGEQIQRWLAANSSSH